jgi:hypothetical protein
MDGLSHIWNRIQRELFPFLREVLDPLTELQQKLVVILEVSAIETYVRESYWRSVGRPKKDREALARAFVAKAVFNLPTTVALIDRLHSDKNLRRICGFERRQDVPDGSTFSRAFTEFAASDLPQRVHAALIEKYHSDTLVGHISRDSTAIVGREKPAKKAPKPPIQKRKRGRPKKGEVVAPKPPKVLEQQQSMTLPQMLDGLPREANFGCKKNSKGYSESWNGYKLHIDTADGGIPISCILTSASVHDSQAAIPLSLISAARVTSLYDLMDAAYDSSIITDHSQALGHVPIIDANRRRGEKPQMDPAKAERYKIRTVAERTNARLKDEFGGRTVIVQGPVKVMAHLMFGIVALTVDQLLQLHLLA